MAGHINTKQQNLRFAKHAVLLDGGITMLVEGLLTYQVVDVTKLINNLGDQDLVRTLQDTTKAELSKVFSGIHLEQISTAQVEGIPQPPKENSYLGGKSKAGDEANAGAEGAASDHNSQRQHICLDVMNYIAPLTEAWGVKIINFQLESTKLADAQYAKEYEEASLKMAKAKANTRALQMENGIVLQKAEAKAQALRIESEGIKMANIITAEGIAMARKIEAESRNEAATMMKDKFGQQFALAEQQVEFAKALKAQVLTVVPESAIGSNLVSQSMFNGNRLLSDLK